MDQVEVFCPASIANLSCGFDVLGLCLDDVGDIMRIIKTTEKGLRITKINNANISYDITKNVAGISAMAMLEASNLDLDFGIEIEIDKKIKVGSGIGSSSASCVGSVFGINELLGRPFTSMELIPFAMEGERAISGSAHADNVAPALLGGITLIRSYTPLDVIELPCPKDLILAVIYPQIEVKTADSRSILKRNIPLKKAIAQWGNLGAFVSSLYTQDFDLMSRSLIDVIVEPERSVLIPKFNEVKKLAISGGALGCGISGSGPSIFSVFRDKEIAQQTLESMKSVYDDIQVEAMCFVSKINDRGVKICK